MAVRSVKVAVPAAIPADLDDWSQSTRKLNDRHPVVHAAIHHAWFERIHPFTDGNGRVGRLLLDFMLLQRGYPPAVIPKAQRPRYLRALELADDGNPHLLGGDRPRRQRHAHSLLDSEPCGGGEANAALRARCARSVPGPVPAALGVRGKAAGGARRPSLVEFQEVAGRLRCYS